MVSAALVGQVIQSYRLRKGMSQEVLSGLAGLDRTHYSKIERGLRSPTLDTLFKIAQALDIPVYAGPTEATAIGNLLAQMLGTGVFATVAEARSAVFRSFNVKKI